MSEAADQRLPRGRHGLSREQVVDSQRGRILHALVMTSAEKGYGRTSVADVIRVAGVSRETFYEQFSSKEDCFMTVLEFAGSVVLAEIGGAAPDAGEVPLERFGRGLRAYLEALAANAELARVLMIEVYAVSSEAQGRRADLQQRFAEEIDGILGDGGEADRFANEALVAAISSMVTTKLAQNDAQGLRGLHAPLLDFARRLHPNRGA